MQVSGAASSFEHRADSGSYWGYWTAAGDPRETRTKDNFFYVAGNCLGCLSTWSTQLGFLLLSASFRSGPKMLANLLIQPVHSYDFNVVVVIVRSCSCLLCVMTTS